ncbi:MAG: hypothetical protein Q4G54_08100 [Pelistega sp.]|nr:hypothetical protein [Pelistega sp.]
MQNNYYMDVGDELIITAGKSIRLQCGQSVILMNADGSIQINGKTLTMNLHDIIRLVSEIVKVN